MDRRKENKENYKLILLIFLFSIVALTSGCAKNYNILYNDIEKSSSLKEKLKLVEELKKEYYSYNYLKGIIFYNYSYFDSAFVYFEKADKYRRKRFNENTIKKIEKTLLNTTSSEYFGEDYEDLFLNYYKALIFAQKDNFEESAIESRIISQKLQLFNTIYREIDSDFSYANDYPFNEFFSGIFYLLYDDFENARISFEIADSLYGMANYDIEKPLFLDSLIQYAKNKNNNIRFVIFQNGQIEKKHEKTIIKRLPIKGRDYELKISYPIIYQAKSKEIHIKINNKNYSLLPQENLSQRAYYMLMKKNDLIIKTATLQASAKLAFSIGADILAYSITKSIIENNDEEEQEEDKDKDKDKTKEENKKKKEKKKDNNSENAEAIAQIAGCIAGTITNRSLNSMTHADIRNIFLLPENIYIIPVFSNTNEIIINNKTYKINKGITIVYNNK